MADRRLTACGVGALLSWAVHGANHVWRGEPHDLLWMCNVAPLMIAAGCLLRRPRPVAIGVLWLTFGTPMWLLDLATGAGMILTSVLPHVLCPALGLVALRRMGWPRRAWAWAMGALVLLFGLTRLVTPPGPNVNLAHRVWSGWEAMFPSYGPYFALLMAVCFATFVVTEQGWRRLAPPPSKEPSV